MPSTKESVSAPDGAASESRPSGFNRFTRFSDLIQKLMNEHSDTVAITRRDQSRFPKPQSRKFPPHQVSVLAINFIGDELNGFVFIAQQLGDVIVLRKTTVFDINKKKMKSASSMAVKD